MGASVEVTHDPDGRIPIRLGPRPDAPGGVLAGIALVVLIGSGLVCSVAAFAALTYVATALAEVGGTFDDVAKLNVHVVDWTPDKMPSFMAVVARAAAKLGVTPMAPGTLVGVAALDVPDHLVEVEAIAVLD
ncbi:RidA family protein [Streptomyces sp. NPDC059999]|uniref:RidA family protein n=1 Tax=Streptomyces sp. NPDC059999 TaxID=3347030 RepID=UPI00369ADDDA